MNKFRDLPSAIVGQLGEQIVARQYKRDGWGVIASYKFSGRNDNEAPAIEIEEEGREITPDLDLSKGGQRIWIEVKTYGRAARNDTLSRSKGHDVYVHGIPVRKYQNYVACEQRTGSSVFLVVVEVDSGEILASRQRISELVRAACFCSGCKSKTGCKGYVRSCPSCNPKGRCRDHQGMYPQYYFDRDLFELIGKVDDRTFTLLHEKQRAHVDRLTAGHAYQRHVHGVVSPQPKAPWTWACLPCNAVGTGDKSSHSCSDVQSYRTAIWERRFRNAMPLSSAEEVSNIVARPIDRADMVSLLGPQWDASNDPRGD